MGESGEERRWLVEGLNGLHPWARCFLSLKKIINKDEHMSVYKGAEAKADWLPASKNWFWPSAKTMTALVIRVSLVVKRFSFRLYLFGVIKIDIFTYIIYICQILDTFNQEYTSNCILFPSEIVYMLEVESAEGHIPLYIRRYHL